ncbi:MAG: GNAT family N-acetyltransferase, partial [Streptomycetaceae bacterium]|nr:GNAT family N-acetyltransferase [Streptomycetaceae bacterium]
SAPAMGFLSGVAVDRTARGAGLGRRVCGFLVDAILAERGRVGLMVDDWNAPAERLNRKLGFTDRRLAAAAMTQPE